MDVDGISIARALEIENASIVSIYVNSSGGIVSVNGAGVETLAGTLNLEYVEGMVQSADVLSGADVTSGPLFRIGNFGAPPAADDFFTYHADGITVKNPGIYDFSGTLFPSGTDALIVAYGLRISQFGGAGDTVNTHPVIINPPSSIGLLTTRVDIRYTEEVTVANTRYYFQPFINKSSGAAYGTTWTGRFKISQSGPIVTPP